MMRKKTKNIFGGAPLFPPIDILFDAPAGHLRCHRISGKYFFLKLLSRRPRFHLIKNIALLIEYGYNNRN
jgi:hypothetical protein